MNSQQGFEWQFGGWAGFPPWLGWTLLVLMAAAGVGLAVWLYRFTLQTLSTRQRVIFVLLRSGFFLSLLVCLAGPSRVVRTYESNHDLRPLAVVVDRSASMTTPDSRGLSRLTAAVRLWKQAEPAALHSFSALRYFSFSGELAPAPDLEGAVNASGPAATTAFYSSLEQALKSAPGGGYGGIVCLTDGLDTTTETSDQLVARAALSHTPLSFAVGENQQAAQENLIIRETVAPSQVLRKTEFPVTALIEAEMSQPRDVPLALWQDANVIANTTLHLRAGSNLIPWTVTLHSDEAPANMNLTWHLGDPTAKEIVAAAVPVVAKSQVSVLFYQGTLDWGFRFINSALQRDRSFAVTGLFSPDLSLTQVVANAPGGLSALPDSADALQPYQIIVLANVSAAQMSEAQQTALSDYVRKGGGLLFLVSDTQMAQSFSRTTLETMLPVVFDVASPQDQTDTSLEDFQARMHSVGGADTSNEAQFASEAMPKAGLDPLKAFALPTGTTRQEIARLFGPSSDGGNAEIPKFASYAHVASAKAGAEVLAVHPEDKTPGNVPRALLVTQRFGQGQVTALLTDALWRWKLSLPSASHAPETFWQDLFLALAGPGANMHFSEQPHFAALGEESVFHIAGTTGLDNPTVIVLAPDSASGSKNSVRPGSHPGEWVLQFSPDRPGTWHVQVLNAQGAEIETLLRVSNFSHGTELSGLPPDGEGLRKLAQATGGAILNDGVPETWSGHSDTPENTLLSEHVRPLWNTWAVLLLALSFYAVELIWRRQAKLL